MRSPTTRRILGTSPAAGSDTPPPCPGNTNALIFSANPLNLGNTSLHPKVQDAFYHNDTLFNSAFATRPGAYGAPRAGRDETPTAPRRAALRAARAPGSGGWGQASRRPRAPGPLPRALRRPPALGPRVPSGA